MKGFQPFFSSIALSTVIAGALAPAALACTGIELKAQDGSAVNGRTAEFAMPLNPSILIVPRNYSFTASLPDNASGMKYQAKYAVIGTAVEGTDAVIDGLNEAGLSVGAFYFPDYAGYTAVNSQNQNQALGPLDFPNWLLTQFSNIDEVKAALKNVVIAPTFFKPWNTVPPFHYVVYDKSGKSIVIEPLNGKLVVYDNPLGVITNSPTFDWHLTNLRNYVNLSPLNVAPVEVNGMLLKSFGQGSGLRGLPGDFTPPSRFVRAAVFSSSAVPSDNAQQAVLQAFHILNQFDIPFGAVREQNNDKIEIDYTQCTSVKDPQNSIYYFRTYDDQSIKSVSFKNLDLNAKNLKRISPAGNQEISDVSKQAR